MQILNKKARRNYTFLEKFEAGISLEGAEVKAIKASRADISQAFVKIIEGEMYIVNMVVNFPDSSSSSRVRKLLVKKGEIISLSTKIKAKKLTLIPVKLYTKGAIIKLQVALSKHKRTKDRRREIRERDLKREIEREIKGV